MRRWLYVHRRIVGQPEAAASALGSGVVKLLRRATDSPQLGTAPDGSFLMNVPSPVPGPGAKQVRARTGVAARRQDHWRVPLSWAASPARHAFPSFDGALELHPLSRSSADLVLVGSYEPPLGIVGEVADVAVFPGVAQRTASELVERLADELEAVLACDGDLADAHDRRPGRLTVRDVMTPDPFVIDEGLPVRSAASLLFYGNVQGAPVVAPDGSLVGVLSEADLLELEATARLGLGQRAARAGRRHAAVTAGEACSQPAQTTTPGTPLRDAARLMADLGVARLVVVDGSRISGIVTRHDVLRALLRTDEQLEDAAAEVLRALGEPAVTVQVARGRATVRGTVTLRSKVALLERTVADIDGILDTDAQLDWAEDDVAVGSLRA